MLRYYDFYYIFGEIIKVQEKAIKIDILWGIQEDLF